MNTYTVYLIGKAVRADHYIAPKFTCGWPYLTPVAGYKRAVVTLYDRAADMMREFKRSRDGGARAYDRAGVMADYLEEHPGETDHPRAVETFLIPFLRRMFTIREPFYEGSPHYV